MKWVLEEMLPALQYFCNLEKLETAVLEEQEIEKKVPLLTQGDASRKAYQEAMLAYVRESRIALNTGEELPRMPDIRDFATACPDKSYKRTGYGRNTTGSRVIRYDRRSVCSKWI